LAVVRGFESAARAGRSERWIVLRAVGGVRRCRGWWAVGPGERIEALLDGQSVDLLAFGEDFANQLDPLHASLRRVPFFDGKDPYATGLTYESDQTKLQNFVARILGGDWRGAPKRVALDSHSQPQ
jgi:hypothetical protein